MKHETLFITVRVLVQSSNEHLSQIVHEVESYSKLELTDTANVNILETEILMSRVHNPNVHRLGAQPFNPNDRKP